MFFTVPLEEVFTHIKKQHDTFFDGGWIVFTAMKREIVRNMGNVSRLK